MTNITRRDFIRQIALIALLATPVGKYLYGKYVEYQNRRRYSRVALPLIRRVYPQLLANQLVSVQPMTLPSSLIFFMDVHHGRRPFAPKWNTGHTARRRCV